MIDFDTSLPKYMGMEMPEHTQESMTNYLVHGYSPGGFLSAMLAMDMRRAVPSADTANRQMLWVIAHWIINHAPEGSWGSYEAIDAWCQNRQHRRTTFADAVEKAEVWKILNRT
jgi:hypothetical protein